MRHTRLFGSILLAAVTAMPAVAQETLPPAAPVDGGTARDALRQIGVRQWVQPEADGVIRGSVVTPRGGTLLDTVPGATVALVDQNLSAHRTRTRADGSFELAGVDSGLYGLFVISERYNAAYAVNVLPPDIGEQGADTRLLQVPAAPIARGYVRRVIRSYLPSAPPRTAPRYRGAEVPPPSARERSQEALFRANLNADGSLTGRVALPPSEEEPMVDLSTLNVAIVDGARTMGRGTVGPNGWFRIDGLVPGVYGLIMAGEAGYAAVGFELAPADASASNGSSTDGRAQLVSYRALMQDGFAFQPVPSQIASGFLPQAYGVGPGVEPFPADGFALGGGFPPGAGFGPGGGFGPGAGPGGGFGGGAGGGAGGGLGPLLGLGALAGVAAAVASDDDEDRITPPPASPAVPVP